MKQRFMNFYCFGDHDAIMVLPLAPFFIEKQTLKKLQNTLPNDIAFNLKRT